MIKEGDDRFFWVKAGRTVTVKHRSEIGFLESSER